MLWIIIGFTAIAEGPRMNSTVQPHMKLVKHLPLKSCLFTRIHQSFKRDCTEVHVTLRPALAGICVLRAAAPLCSVKEPSSSGRTSMGLIPPWMRDLYEPSPKTLYKELLTLQSLSLSRDDTKRAPFQETELTLPAGKHLYLLPALL